MSGTSAFRDTGYSLDFKFKMGQLAAIGNPRAQAVIVGLTDEKIFTPLWSRYMPGVLEARRDRRIHRG